MRKIDDFNERALHYLSWLYCGQKKQEHSYGDTYPVIGVHLIGAKNKKIWNDPWKDSFIRNYTFRTENGMRGMKGMRLVQYSLGDIDLSSDFFDEKEALKEWLEFFLNASHIKNEPILNNPEVKKAYEKIDVENLERNHPELTCLSEILANLTKQDALERAEGKAEGLQKGFEKGFKKRYQEVSFSEKQILVQRLVNLKKTDDEICLIADISEEKLKELKNKL